MARSVWTEKKREQYKTRNRSLDDKVMDLIQNRLARFVVVATNTNRCPRCGRKHPEDQDQHCLPLFSEYGIE